MVFRVKSLGAEGDKVIFEIESYAPKTISVSYKVEILPLINRQEEREIEYRALNVKITSRLDGPIADIYYNAQKIAERTLGTKHPSDFEISPNREIIIEILREVIKNSKDMPLHRDYIKKVLPTIIRIIK